MPFPQPRVLGLLADDRVLYDGVAEVIHHRRDGKDAPQPFVQIFIRRGLRGLRVRVIRARQHGHRGDAQSCNTLRLVKVENVRVIVTS